MNNDIFKHTAGALELRSIEQTVKALTAEPHVSSGASTSMTPEAQAESIGENAALVIDSHTRSLYAERRPDSADLIPGTNVSDLVPLGGFKAGEIAVFVGDPWPTQNKSGIGGALVKETIERGTTVQVNTEFSDSQLAMVDDFFRQKLKLDIDPADRKEQINRAYVAHWDGKRRVEAPQVRISEGFLHYTEKAKPVWIDENGANATYSDGFVVVRKNPALGWTIDWLRNGQRAWVDLGSIPKKVLQILSLNFENEDKYPRGLRQAVRSYLDFPSGELTTPEGGQGGTDSVTYSVAPDRALSAKHVDATRKNSKSHLALRKKR